MAVASHSEPAGWYGIASALGCRLLTVHCWPPPTSTGLPRLSARALGAQAHAAAAIEPYKPILIAVAGFMVTITPSIASIAAAPGDTPDRWLSYQAVCRNDVNIGLLQGRAAIRIVRLRPTRSPGETGY